MIKYENMLVELNSADFEAKKVIRIFLDFHRDW